MSGGVYTSLDYLSSAKLALAQQIQQTVLAHAANPFLQQQHLAEIAKSVHILETVLDAYRRIEASSSPPPIQDAVDPQHQQPLLQQQQHPPQQQQQPPPQPPHAALADAFDSLLHNYAAADPVHEHEREHEHGLTFSHIVDTDAVLSPAEQWALEMRTRFANDEAKPLPPPQLQPQPQPQPQDLGAHSKDIAKDNAKDKDKEKEKEKPLSDPKKPAKPAKPTKPKDNNNDKPPRMLFPDMTATADKDKDKDKPKKRKHEDLPTTD